MADEIAPGEATQRLAAAGINPPAEELAFFEMTYPILRQRADTIYAVDLGYAL